MKRFKNANQVHARSVFVSVCAWLALVCLSIGCRQRAFTEVYVENMAGEIRTLEDLVYTYDAEYRSLENELDDLKRTNAELQMRLDSRGKVQGLNLNSPLLNDGKVNKLPNDSFKLNQRPSNVVNEPVFEPDIFIPPPIRKQAPSTLDRSEPAPIDRPNESSGSILPAPSESKSILDRNGANPRSSLDPSPASQLNKMSKLTTPPGLPTEILSNSVRHGRVEMPDSSRVVLASATSTTSIQDAPPSRSEPQDRRVRGIEFHSTMCRGHNFDDKPGDDGLYLVLQPRNLDGATLNSTGELIVVVEDPQNDDARIGRWVYSPKQLDELLEPIGANQGFHIKIPWDQSTPSESEVEVHVKFTADDGTMSVNRKMIHLRKRTHAQSTWTPR